MNDRLRAYLNQRNYKRRIWAPRAQPRMFRYLTAKQHQEIMRLVSDGQTMASVALKYGVGYSTVTSIVYGVRKPRLSVTP